MLTIEQVAKRFGVTTRFVRGLISKNEIEYVRHSARRIKFTEAALQDYLTRKTIPVPKIAIDDSQYSSLKLAVKQNRSLKSKDETVLRGITASGSQRS